MNSLFLIAAVIAICLVFAALAATATAIFQLAYAGLEWFAARLRRRRRAQRSKPLSRRA